MGGGTSARPKVLVVDDDALIRLDLTSSLSEAGFDAIEVSNPDDAIAILTASSEIAVVVTDIEMAGSIDGLELAELVRNRWPPVLIVVISGHHRLGELNLPERTRFFAKPYDVRRVIGAIRELLP